MFSEIDAFQELKITIHSGYYGLTLIKVDSFMTVVSIIRKPVIWFAL